MNIKINCKILLILLLTLSCNLWAIELPDGTDAEVSTFTQYANKSFKSVVFLETTKIEKPFGTFFATEASFYESGALESLTCDSEKDRIAKTVFGELAVCQDAGWYDEKKKREVFFYESGEIKKCILRNHFLSPKIMMMAF